MTFAMPRRVRVVLLAVFLATGALAEHPCHAEVASACPDRPGPEVAACLKDESEHEKPTAISSECTDFIALNVACTEAIGKFCDDAFFSRDTILCLGEWTDQASIDSKCANVMKWAMPKTSDSDEDDGPTDELGLSEKDYAEKKAWQASRKKARTAAIEKLKDDSDTEEMELLKKQNPEEYKQRKQEQEDRQKEHEAMRKRERLLQAAIERKQEDEDRQAGIAFEDELSKTDEPTDTKKRRRYVPPAKKGSWLPYILGGLFVAFIFFNVLNFVNKGKDD
jgi:hypothetical protein